jgi:hypothetical protein
MVRRDEITDQAWKTLQPLLPRVPAETRRERDVGAHQVNPGRAGTRRAARPLPWPGVREPRRTHRPGGSPVPRPAHAPHVARGRRSVRQRAAGTRPRRPGPRAPAPGPPSAPARRPQRLVNPDLRAPVGKHQTLRPPDLGASSDGRPTPGPYCAARGDYPTRMRAATCSRSGGPGVRPGNRGWRVVVTTMLELFKQGGCRVGKATESSATTGADVGDAGNAAGMGDRGERRPRLDGGPQRRPLGRHQRAQRGGRAQSRRRLGGRPVHRPRPGRRRAEHAHRTLERQPLVPGRGPSGAAPGRVAAGRRRQLR